MSAWTTAEMYGCLLAWAVAGLSGCSGDEPADDVTDPVELASKSSALHVASADGQFLNLAVYTGSPFAFAVKAPVDSLLPGWEMELTESDGWDLEFSGLVPGEGDGLEPGWVGPTGEEDGAWCEEGNIDGVEDGVSCQLPWVGYGTDELIDFHVGASSPGARALVYFHSVGTAAGSPVVMDYLFMIAHPTDQGGCILFLDYSRAPVHFVVGEELETSLLSPEESSAGGPVSPIDSRQLLAETGRPAPSPCSLDLFPELFVDFCPVVSGGSGQGEPSHWAQKCAADHADLGGYPLP